MNERKKRVRRLYKYHKKYNLHLLNKISRILSWLLPGLVIKRWMLTSAIGFLTALLGLSIWTNLSPLYWFTEIFFGLLTGLTKILPVSLLGPLIFIIGLFARAPPRVGRTYPFAYIFEFHALGFPRDPQGSLGLARVPQ